MQLVLLFKKGDPSLLKNWRGIMLLDATIQLVNAMISERLQTILDDIGDEPQNGFSKKKGTTDGTFVLKQCLKRRQEHGLETWAAFFDQIKAFDSVNLEALFLILPKYGVPPRLLKLIQALHVDVSIQLSVANIQTSVPKKPA
jgi:hypothetical protein